MVYFPYFPNLMKDTEEFHHNIIITNWIDIKKTGIQE